MASSDEMSPEGAYSLKQASVVGLDGNNISSEGANTVPLVRKKQCNQIK